MARITFTPVVYGQYKLQDGNYSVRMRITHRRKSRFLTTSETAAPSQLTRSLTIKDAALMTRLRNLETRMRNAIADLDMYALEVMDIDQIVAHMHQRINGSFRLELFSFWQESVTKMKKSSGQYYMTALRSFRQFMGCDTLDISRVTSRLLRQYEDWLVERHGRGARAVTLYISCLRHIHTLARRTYNSDGDELLIRNPFEYYSPPKERPARHRDVDASVIQDMIDTRHQLKGRERKAVDAFLLSFALMGMNAADIITCSPAHDDVLIYYRKKTCDRRADRAEMRVRIEDCIRPIYDEWADDDGIHAFRFHRENKDGHSLNTSLAVGLAQYQKRKSLPMLNFYSARHTWASVAYKIGVEKGVINDCLCHKDASMRVTDIYIHKDWSVLWRANAKVLEQFKW